MLRINNVVEQVEHLQLLKNFWLSTGLLWVSVIWADQSEPYSIVHAHVYACLERGVYTTVMNLQIGSLTDTLYYAVLQYYCS